MPAKRRRKKKTAPPAAPAANATAAPAALPRFPDPASLDRDDRVEVSIEMKTLGNKFFAAKDFGECRDVLFEIQSLPKRSPTHETTPPPHPNSRAR